MACEAPVGYKRLTSTVTVWSPGLIVSCEPTLTMPVAVTVIVTLWPAASAPDCWDTVTLPSSPDGNEMDQLTGPPFAVRVNELLDPTATATLCVETLSVPSADEDGDEPDPVPLDPPLPDPLLLSVPEVDPEVEAFGVGVVTMSLLAGEPPPVLGVFAPAVGEDDALPVSEGDGEGTGDAAGFVMEGALPGGFAWVGL